jgi:hypothetical protein
MTGWPSVLALAALGLVLGEGPRRAHSLRLRWCSWSIELGALG